MLMLVKSLMKLQLVSVITSFFHNIVHHHAAHQCFRIFRFKNVNNSNFISNVISCNEDLPPYVCLRRLAPLLCFSVTFVSLFCVCVVALLLSVGEEPAAALFYCRCGLCFRCLQITLTAVPSAGSCSRGKGKANVGYPVCFSVFRPVSSCMSGDSASKLRHFQV